MTSCSYYNSTSCRSCTLLEQTLLEWETWQQNRLKALAEKKLGDNVFIENIFSPKTIFPSRVKAKLSVGGSSKAPVLGITDSALEITELERCPLHLPVLNQAASACKNLISELELEPYDINKRQGEVKGLIIVCSSNQKSLLLRFVLRSKNSVQTLIKNLPEIKRQIPALKVLSANIQPIPHAILEGEEEILLTEDSHIWDSYQEFSLALGPQSFLQVTHETARALYQEARTFFAQHPGDTLLDLYCGAGGFSFAASPHTSSCLGVELSATAVCCAELGKKENATENTEFLSADVSQFLADYQGQPPKSILLNPPRRGLEEDIIARVAALSPEHVLYSSCSPETCFRDLSRLQKHYRVSRVKPFNMFPFTEHIELWCELALR